MKNVIYFIEDILNIFYSQNLKKLYAVYIIKFKKYIKRCIFSYKHYFFTKKKGFKKICHIVFAT